MSPKAARLLDKAGHAVRSARLLVDGGEPAFAVGRAYYAMLYSAEAMLAELGLEFRKHSAVHSAFGERYVNTGAVDAQYHRWLLAAFYKRIAGDYSADVDVEPAEVEELIRQAEAFREMAARILKRESTQ
jgi:uncharacterized protein (UPF0332 family)